MQICFPVVNSTQKSTSIFSYHTLKPCHNTAGPRLSTKAVTAFSVSTIYRVSTNLTEQISRRYQEGFQEKSRTCLRCFGLPCNVPNLLHLIEHVMMTSKQCSSLCYSTNYNISYIFGRPYYRSSLWYSVSSVVCLSSVCHLSVTFCIVAKRYVLAKKCLKE